MSAFNPNHSPQAEITLAKAEENDSRIWVYETHNEVVAMVNMAIDNKTPLVTFSRVQGIGNPGVLFSTKPGNVMNVRDISA